MPGTKYKAVRWTIENAADEFDLEKQTLTKRLKRGGAEPGKDGKFSTKQIASAVFGSLEAEQTRLTAAKADQEEDERAKRRGELIEIDAVAQSWEIPVSAVKSRIQGMPSKMESRLGLTTEQRKMLEIECDETLAELAKWDISALIV